MKADSVQVVLHADGNSLMAEIRADDMLPEEKTQALYAFYLLLEGTRIETREYTKDNSARFYPPCSGRFKAVGFVKLGEKKFIRETPYLDFALDDTLPQGGPVHAAPVPISIFGSCVTRDIFNLDVQKRFDVKTYVARQSMVSAVSAPIPCREEDIKLESKFQRRAVWNDLVKNTFSSFRADGSKYLIIDLIDERFEVARYAHDGIDSFYTYSALTQESGYFESPDLVKRGKRLLPWPEYYLGDEKLNVYVKRFCQMVLDIYPAQNIILHKAVMLNYYKKLTGEIVPFPRNHIENSKRINALLRYLYDLLEGYFTGCTVIYCCDGMCAEESHRWGLAPMHYEQEYYKLAYADLIKLCR